MDYPFIPPSTTCVSEDLLFFDTFSHSGSEKNNFDLVQFPSPVVIDLIKIVPLGQPIEAKIPGSVRLGATNPSNCELEFFINELANQDADTMTDLGKFFCSEKDTDFSPPVRIQTDGLLLRGSYRTLTLAIFGQIAAYDEKAGDQEQDQVMLSASSPPAQTPASPVASERDIPYIVRSIDHQELYRRSREDVESYEESTVKSGDMFKEICFDNTDTLDNAILDTIESGPSKEINNLDDYSGSEGAPLVCYSDKDKKMDGIDYSTSPDQDTSAKRSIVDDSHKNAPESNEMVNDGAANDSSDDEKEVEWSFKAASYCPSPLLYFPDPSLTLQERSLIVHDSKMVDSHYRAATEKEIEKVKETFTVLNCPEDYRNDDWVTLIEDLTNDLANISLSQTVSSGDMLEFLVKQVLDALDYDLALKQKQTGFKVRHLRAGLKLATILFQCGDRAVLALLEASVLHKILELYNRDQMSLPLQLLILKCLSAACDTVKGVEYMIFNKYDWHERCFTLEDIKERIEKGQSGRGVVEREDKSHHKFNPINSNDDSSNLEQEETGSKLSYRRRTSDKLADIDYSTKSMTCYQYLILILLSETTTRVTIAIGNLIKKIRLYLNLARLSEINAEIAQESEDNVFESEDPFQKANIDLEQAVLIIQDIVQLTKDNCANIAQPIRHLPAKTQFQIKPNTTDSLLALYRWLKHFGTLDHIDNLLKSSRFCTDDMVSATFVERSIRFQSLSLAFLQQLLDSTKGTQFLLSSDCLGSITRLLTSLAEVYPPKRSSHVRLADGIENCLSASLCREEFIAASGCRDASLKMVYNFKVFSCIDQLFHFHRELISKRNDFHCDPEKVLHQLYIVSEHPYGLAALVKHLSCIGNLDCLLRFLDVPDNHKYLEFVKETSIDYALELVGSFFRLNNNVLEISEEYLDTLVDLCKTKEKNLSVRIKSLLPWINPFDNDQPFPLISYTEETFRLLTRVIRRSIPDCSIPFAKGLDFELPPQMITAVRILRQLCIPPQVEQFIANNFDVYSTQKFVTSITKSGSFTTFFENSPHQQNFNQSWNLNIQLSRQNGTNGVADDPYVDNIGQISNTFKLFQPYEESICGELKYHYGIMQVFEQEGLRRLLNTLRELTGNYSRPIHQSAALSGLRGRIVLSYINSVIVLLHSITCHLIDARGSEFKDTSIIPVILETYSLLCFVPKPTTEPLKAKDVNSLQSSITIRIDNFNLAQQTKKMIISILMSYTQMCLSVSESEEKVISKSMWTKMLKEVFEFTLSTPVFFYHGLDVLTQILPSPLPCSSMMDSIDQEQLFKNINHRKLWSAHLHPLHLQIEQLISNLSISYPNNIRTLLHYLCNQLCDLSSNAACMVAKIITDTLLSHAAKLSLGNPTSDNQLNDSGQTNLPTQSDETKLHTYTQSSTKESAYAVKMVLNLLSNLITNQAFESAFSNHLQVLGKKDEKILANLQNTLRIHDDYKSGESIEENEDGNAANATAANLNLVSVSQLIESIKSMNEATSKDGYANLANNIVPPDELTRINLLNIAHKTSDRFSLSTGLLKTYRLKVLLDLNSRAHRSSESTSSSKRFEHQTNYSYPLSSGPSSRKSYVPPPPPATRSRARPPARPDSFRSRPQNTSRPPSIHVDDFIDLYGNSPGQPSSSNRYGPISSKSSPMNNYRSSSRGSGGGSYPSELPMNHSDPHSSHRHASFFGPQPPIPHSGSPYSSRSQHGKAKYMKSK